MSEQIIFTSDKYRIEGRLSTNSPSNAVIITHPHPLYGGDMNNSIVDILDDCYQRAGYSTIKFNFRGAGSSEGVYDNGNGEKQDVFSAFRFLTERGFTSISAAGYSFGAWIITACAAEDNRFDHITLISPPVSFMSFDDFPQLENIRYVVFGDKDDFAEKNHVNEILAILCPAAAIDVISGADHFYFGYTRDLGSLLAKNIPVLTE